MFLKHTKLTAAALAFILLAPAYVDAKGGRGGGGSSFSSSRSSSSYSKPATSLPGASRPATINTGGSQNRNITNNTNTYSKPATNNSSQGYTRPSVPAPPPANTTTMKPDAVGALGNAASATMSRDSLQKYMQERNALGKAPAVFDKSALKSDPLVRQNRTQYPKIDDYIASRERERLAYSARHPETARYAQSMQPNYGLFDNNFLIGMMLGHWTSSNNNASNANAAWLKSQSNQEWYTHWRADLEKASQENQDLKEKIQDLDRQMAELKATDQPAKVLPDGVPSSLALIPEAMIVDAYDNHSLPWGWIIFMLLLGSFSILLFYFYQKGAHVNRRRFA